MTAGADIGQASHAALPEARSGVAAGHPARRSISSDDLLAGHRMMLIRHGAEEYRLQVTRSGKLILTK